jgi:hypothetical protein
VALDLRHANNMTQPTMPLNSPPINPSSSERDDTMRGILVIALLVSFLYVVTLFSLWHSYIEAELQGAIVTLLGGSALLMAVGWYYQSSSSSKAKSAVAEKA